MALKATQPPAGPCAGARQGGAISESVSRDSNRLRRHFRVAESPVDLGSQGSWKRPLLRDPRRECAHLEGRNPPFCEVKGYAVRKSGA